MGLQSREVLTLDGSEAGTVSFGRKNGCFVSNSFMVLILLVFATALVATGLLVFFFAGTPNPDQAVEYAFVPSPISQKEGAKTSNEIPEPTTKGPSKKGMKSKDLNMTMDVRLPLDIKPLHYYVRLIPFINGNFSIHGYLEFTFEVLKPTSSITLHLKDIITKNDTVKVYPATEGMRAKLKVESQTYDLKRQFYVASLMKELMVGQKYVIAMDYTGYLNSDMVGFYRSKYKDEAGKNRWLAATQFQPTDARKAFPCLDEPALKANFTIVIAREEDMTSISNMPIEKSEPMPGNPGWFWDKFQTSVPMSTYLVAFAVSDFAYLESTGIVDYQFRVYARKSALSQANYALKVGPPILKFFEEFFKIPYPLPKQDMIALPDFSAGAMENWGLITYRETAMLYDASISKASDKFRVGVVVSHELAHQWFGNLVTPFWWTDLWLNEGFASYMEYLGLNAVEPTFKLMEQFVVIDLQSVFRLDCLETSHPINIPVNHPDEINEIFDRISYSKGASIIRMMSHFLTEDTFRKGLTNYLKAFAYDSAEQDDLWRYLTDQAHKDRTLATDMTVKQIMDTWTLQMGFPVITVMRKPNGMATLKQERFILIKNENSTDKHDYKWWVPLTYTTQNERDFAMTKPTIWMKPSEAEKTISGIPSYGWFIFNIQETGYYRVNYEVENWNALIDALKNRHTDIGEVNRAQLIDDALSLSRAGLLKYETSLSLLSYLASEDEYVPWTAALSNLGFIKSMFSQKGGYGSLKVFLTRLLIPLYNKVGFADNINDPFLVQRRRASITSWMCMLDYKPCIDESVKLFKQWMKQPDNYTLISPNLKSFVYCAGVAEGGLAEWQFAWDRYENANVGSEKRTLLYALGCSKKSWILSGYLERAMSEKRGIRKQDFRSVLGSVAGNRIGSSIAWEFLKDRWEEILDYFGSVSFTLGGIIKSVTGGLNTKNQLMELTLFRDTYSEKSKSARRAIDQAVENTRNNLEWMNSNYDVIHSWLSVNGYNASV